MPENSQVNSLEASTGERCTAPVEHAATISGRNACPRCIERGYSDTDLSEYLSKRKEFYCDVGMKSVLRKIRRFFEIKFRVLNASVPKKCNFTEWPEDFKAACMHLYREEVLRYGSFNGAAGALNFHGVQLPLTDEEEANSIYQTFQKLLDNAKDSSLDC